ncbi:MULTISPECIES: hypothetical protein [Achromobacter]|uniref:hypothetical protein n=1 Tax=Achromobacter TaxID=222 RepID=UPI0023F996F2|nr:hypothetical protein [Achromobacter anxifer]MDF8365088.1 hypothetical protein [Achromobacter anxifer]
MNHVTFRAAIFCVAMIPLQVTAQDATPLRSTYSPIVNVQSGAVNQTDTRRQARAPSEPSCEHSSHRVEMPRFSINGIALDLGTATRRARGPGCDHSTATGSK